MTIKQIIDEGYEIFDFEYELFDENYKPILERNFIDRFMFSEIAFETVGKFKHFLKYNLRNELLEFNRLFESQRLEQRILDNYDVTEKFSKTNTDNSNSTGQGTNTNTFKDVPVGFDQDIQDTDNPNSITKNIDSNSSNITASGTENWERTMKGNIGVQTDADAVIKYESSVRNIEEELLNKLYSKLFIQLW